MELEDMIHPLNDIEKFPENRKMPYHLRIFHGLRGFRDFVAAFCLAMSESRKLRVSV